MPCVQVPNISKNNYLILNQLINLQIKIISKKFNVFNYFSITYKIKYLFIYFKMK